MSNETISAGGYVVLQRRGIVVTVSTQIAAVVVLVWKDFGISADDLGAFTVEIVWSVALLTMLPTLLLSFLPSITQERLQLSFAIICISWLLFMYTFVSRLINNYGPSQIGSRSGSVISSLQWDVIVNLCFGDTTLSDLEKTAFGFFAIGGSLFMSLVIATRLIWSTVDSWAPHFFQRVSKLVSGLQKPHKDREILLICCVLAWGIAEAWSVIRIRQIRAALAKSIEGDNIYSDWSFGQIIAIVAVAPVVVDGIYAWREPSN